MLERLAEYFYNPLVFWAVPLLLVVLAASWRKLRVWRQRRLSGIAGKNPEDSS
jgi:hypothetical protein